MNNLLMLRQSRRLLSVLLLLQIAAMLNSSSSFFCKPCVFVRARLYEESYKFERFFTYSSSILVEYISDKYWLTQIEMKTGLLPWFPVILPLHDRFHIKLNYKIYTYIFIEQINTMIMMSWRFANVKQTQIHFYCLNISSQRYSIKHVVSFNSDGILEAYWEGRTLPGQKCDGVTDCYHVYNCHLTWNSLKSFQKSD